MGKLISFIMPSIRLNNVKGFFDNIEETASDPACVEVLIKFDDEQEGIVEFINEEIAKRPFTIKYIQAPRLEGVFSVWVGIERLFMMTDPTSYFIQIMSDEPRFDTKKWDEILLNYKNFFEDGVFRLRLSSTKFSNYPSHYDCTFKPDSFPIYTRRWLELTEGVGNCWGSDAYQQCVAFQLSLGPGGYFNYYRANGLCRDVVINDIKMSGLEFGVGVMRDEMRRRHKRNLKEWSRLTSFTMQEHFSYLARRINGYVWAEKNRIVGFKLIKNERRKTVSVQGADGVELIEFSYSIQRMVVYAQNLVRFCVTLPRRLISDISSAISVYFEKNSPVENGSISSGNGNQSKLTFKMRLRLFLSRTAITARVPFNVLLGLVDRYFVAQPPGISILYDGRDVKRKVSDSDKGASVSQRAWLQVELEEQGISKQKLRNTVFVVGKD